MQIWLNTVTMAQYGRVDGIVRFRQSFVSTYVPCSVDLTATTIFTYQIHFDAEILKYFTVKYLFNS